MCITVYSGSAAAQPGPKDSFDGFTRLVIMPIVHHPVLQAGRLLVRLRLSDSSKPVEGCRPGRLLGG